MEENNINLNSYLFEVLDASEKNSEFVAIESKTYLQDAWQRFKKNKLALSGFIFLVILILMAIIVPIVSPYTYDGQDYTVRNVLPNMQHWMGTDKLGRDIFVRVMYGCRISLTIGFVASFLNLIIGVFVGGICGYFGGKLDLIVMRITDCLYSIPDILYVILIMLMFGSNIFSVLIGISIASWIGMARQVRSQILSLKEQEFSLAAYVIGASQWRIIFKHLIINCMGPIIVAATMMIPSAIFTEAFLSFIGIGISAPMASLGSLASEARGLLQNHPVQIIWPVTTLCLTILSLNFIGDGMGEALDPKKK